MPSMALSWRAVSAARAADWSPLCLEMSSRAWLWRAVSEARRAAVLALASEAAALVARDCAPERATWFLMPVVCSRSAWLRSHCRLEISTPWRRLISLAMSPILPAWSLARSPAMAVRVLFRSPSWAVPWAAMRACPTSPLFWAAICE